MLLKTFCTADGTYEKKLHKVNLSMTEKSSTWEDICEITKKIYNILNMFLKKKSNVRNSIKRLWVNYANLIYPTKSSNKSLNDKASDTKNKRDKECLGKT